MPLFDKKELNFRQRPLLPIPFEECQQQNGVDNDDETQTSQVEFRCQLAHGSPLGLISFLSNVKELASFRLEMYQKIAECYDIPAEDILFCTINTHKLDMDTKKLLSAQKDLILFAHIKGQPKEIEVVKTEDEFGVNIVEYRAGYAIIHTIREGSIASRIPHMEVGDYIEKIDGESMAGKGSVEVAKILGEIPLGTTFTLRLVEPLKSRFGSISPKTTIRYKANGQATIEDELATSSFSLCTAFPRRELTETEETLRRLELALSDALLVLPRRQPAQVATLSALSSLMTFFTQLFTTLILEPSQQLYNWIWSRFTPPPPETPPSPPRQTSPPNIRCRANIHRLPGDRGTDDDNNTWNGNSTQQM